MTKAEFVVFVTANAVVFVLISVIAVVLLSYYLIGKAKKLQKIMNNIESIAKNHSHSMRKIDKRAATIKTYNEAIFDYLKQIRKFLIEYNLADFDSKLLNSISSEMKQEKEKITKDDFESIKKTSQHNLNKILPKNKRDIINETPFIEKNDEYSNGKIASKSRKIKFINVQNSNDSEKNISPSKSIYKIGNNKNEDDEYLVLKELEGWKTN